MSVTISWADSHHKVLLCVFPPTWNWEELAKAQTETQRLLAGQKLPIPLILDQRDTSLPVDTLTHLPELVSSAPMLNRRLIHPLIVVSNSAMVRIVAELFRRVYAYSASDIVQVPDLDAAFAWLDAGPSAEGQGSLAEA